MLVVSVKYVFQYMYLLYVLLQELKPCAQSCLTFTTLLANSADDI